MKMKLRRSAAKFALMEFGIILIVMFLWVVSTRPWESMRYALLGTLVLAIYSLLTVATTIAFVAVGRSTKHRILRWFCIPLSLFLWLLLVPALSSDTTLFLLTIAVIIGLWLGMLDRWPRDFHSDVLSVGMTALVIIAILGAVHAVIVMQRFPTVVLTYSFCIGLFAAGFTVIRGHNLWRLSVGTFSFFLGLLLLREPFLPLVFFGFSPLPEHPYIQNVNPVKFIFFLIGTAVGVTNGRHGHFHSLSSSGLKRLFIVGVAIFSISNLLCWEYSTTGGTHEITTMLSTVWLFALVSISKGGHLRDEAQD